jgi:septal ring factor EnvC (AmiA/AmiB activator)
VRLFFVGNLLLNEMKTMLGLVAAATIARGMIYGPNNAYMQRSRELAAVKTELAAAETKHKVQARELAAAKTELAATETKVGKLAAVVTKLVATETKVEKLENEIRCELSKITIEMVDALSLPDKERYFQLRAAYP